MTNNTNTTNAATTDNSGNTPTVAEIVANALNGDTSGYIGADVTIKANVRKALNTGRDAAIDAMDLETAIAYKTAITACVGAKAAKSGEPVNHTEIVANRAFTLIAAGIALFRGEATPTGINPEDVDFSDNSDIRDILDVLDGSYIPDTVDNKDITAIATQKVTKSDVRVDIGAHIAKVIEGAATGTFFSVRHIARTSTDVAPNGCPSDGAVAMRLFPQKGDCTLIGTLPIKPVTTPVKGLIVTD